MELIAIGVGLIISVVALCISIKTLMDVRRDIKNYPPGGGQ